jgi:predicted RNA binding protein YcfA (HicA-like mRNA interferase family)
LILPARPPMARLPRLTAREIAAVLEKSGFSLSRQSGSHMIYKNAAGKRATVPYHASRILHPKVLKSILRDADLSPEDLERLL